MYIKDTRSNFLLLVLEKLAAPLVAAISEVSVRNMMLTDPSQPGAMRPEAEHVAGLLTKATQTSIGLTHLVDMLNLKENEADTMRLALTTLASPMIANLYRLTGRVATDAELDRIMNALNSVITYSDSFAAAGDVNARMTAIDADFYPSDPHQVTLQYINALIPAVNSVMAYSFGQPEKKLVQDVTERLVREAKNFREKMFPNLDEREAARAELAVLRMAAQIYSQCHFAEMAKLMATEEQARQGLAPAMTTLWQAFGLRLQMLEIVADVLIPDANTGRVTTSGSGSVAPDAAPPVAASPVVSAPAAPAAPPSAPPPANADAPKANPMAFFAKKTS
jgi:hypothetical protein